MGIRYYAYPVSADMTALATVSPRDFISSDPLADAWGLSDERPPMLYLDKCWRELQWILAPRDGSTARAAYQLVSGEVTMAGLGWHAFVRFLDPDQVRAIADDLATIDECFVMDALASNRVRPYETYEAQVQYTQSYLDAATEFTAELARAGQGLAYLIG